MGYSTVAEYARAAADGTIGLHDAIKMHLRGNCFPPVHPDFFPGVFDAVDHANAGDWEESITFPNGRNFTAGEVIEKLHLGVFVYADDDEPLEVNL